MGISTCPCGSFRSEHARLGPLNILGCKKMLFMFSLHPVGRWKKGEREDREKGTGGGGGGGGGGRDGTIPFKTNSNDFGGFWN